MFVKVRFTNGKDHTAGLILDSSKVKAMSIPEISRLFPYSEAGKMKRLEVSKEYATWEDAFGHQF